MDFTQSKFRDLLSGFKSYGYEMVTFADYLKGKSSERFVILRHDVDLKPQNSLCTARMEEKMGARGSYYFRAVPESWNEGIIKEIAQMGHEIGYHYESLSTCHGNMEVAYQDFCMNLNRLRKLTKVETICMHGSPRSSYDSKDLWTGGYFYRDLDIIGEPYFDVDFSKVFYLTDTGRCWDGYKVSVRDKIEDYQNEWTLQDLTFHSTDEIIKALRENRIPPRLMLTVHPQRWNDFGVVWIEELVLQNVKNVVKRLIVARRK